MTEHRISVPMPTDEDGMIGRTRPSPDCERYFKLKPGTGLPTDTCHCPYCGHEGDSSDFVTEDQKQYAITYASPQIIDPMMRKFASNIRGLNSPSRGGLIQIRFDVRYRPVPIHSYIEQELETKVACDACGFEFAVYGVFASCPDCQRLNALRTLTLSLEVARKRVRLAASEEIDADLRARFPQDALRDVVGAFDSYGKALRAKYPGRIRTRAKSNLFQDLEALDSELAAANLPGIAALLETAEHERLLWFFQARHVYEHNAGVIDRRFVEKLPSFGPQVGRLLPLSDDELLAGIDAVESLARKIDALVREDGH